MVREIALGQVVYGNITAEIASSVPSTLNTALKGTTRTSSTLFMRSISMRQHQSNVNYFL